jgi:hypothetical protein
MDAGSHAFSVGVYPPVKRTRGAPALRLRASQANSSGGESNRVASQRNPAARTMGGIEHPLLDGGDSAAQPT